MPLLAYRYAFNNREKLLAVTVDYRKLVAQQPAASRVGRLADWVFSMVFDSSRATVMYMGSPLLCTWGRRCF
jgi:hypothetical protein